MIVPETRNESPLNIVSRDMNEPRDTNVTNGVSESEVKMVTKCANEPAP